MHVRLCGPNNLSTLMGPGFPSLADEIAEPRPDMNINVTAFNESKKFYYVQFELRVLENMCYAATEL